MNSRADFHITDTPTLHFVAIEDEERLSEDLQARFEEALRLADERAEVMAAAEATRVEEQRVEELKKSERGLHLYARESSAEVARVAGSALDAIIYSSASGEPDFTKAGELAVLETRNRHAGRALERLVEHLIPLAQIVQLRADSYELMTRARAVEKIAQERAERVLGQMREAVSEEIVLPVDMSKGVAGALLAHAAGLKRLAVQQSDNAERIEKSYMAREKGSR